MQSAVMSPAFGFEPKNIDIVATNRTGAVHVVGDLCQLDLSNAQSEVTNNDAGSNVSGLSNVIVPAAFTYPAGSPLGKIYAVALEANADNTVGTYRVKGIVEARVVNGSGDTGVTLVAAASSVLDATSIVDEHIYGIILDDPGADTETLTRILFDGTGGFGQTGA